MAASRGRRITTAVAFVLVLVLGVAGFVTGTFDRAGRAVLYRTGLWSDGGSSSLPPQPTQTTASTAPVEAAPVLAAATEGPAPDPPTLRRRVRAVESKDVGGRVSALVEDQTGKALYGSGQNSAAIPASTMKILTSAASLSALGPNHRFSTTVTEPRAGQIVLVGGGDPYLCGGKGCAPGAARLDTLVTRTAGALTKAGTTRVTLSYDTSLFPGPAWNPTWPAGYGDQTTPTSALWVDEGRRAGYSPGPRETDPARAAANTFAKRLEKAGITVTKVRAGRSPQAARTIAQVESQPVSSIVEQLLVHSDNDAAEVMLRQVAVAAGRTGSISDGQRAVRAALDSLGLDVDGLRIVDGSGLSRDNRVPARALVDVLRLGIDDDHPELRGLVTGLPVGGVSGSLSGRYVSTGTSAGRGFVHAKTGTLRKTHALAGYVRTRDGALVAFAFLVNDADNDYAARVWLDRVSAVIAGCGCDG